MKLTKQLIDTTLPASSKDVYLWDKSPVGFGLRIRPSGSKTFFYSYRPGGGRSASKKRLVIGQHGKVTLEQARKVAQEAAGQVAAGRDPVMERRAAREAMERQKLTVGTVADQFVEQYVKPRNRTWEEYERILNYYVIPKIADRSIHDLTKADINSLLLVIGKENGRPMADHVLAVLRKMMNWLEVRDDAFRSPIVKGMALTSPSQMKRDRCLNEDEIRAVWNALEQEPYPYGPMVKLLFLTAQRLGEVATARWDDLRDGCLVIPAGRYKTKKAVITPLPDEATRLIYGLPRTGPFIFSSGGRGPFSGFSKAKERLDTASGVRGWRIHDIRRTVRTLMVAVDVRPDIAERVLGHAIPGVAGVYDQHDYLKQKKAALEQLAAELERIIAKPSGSNVVPFAKKSSTDVTELSTHMAIAAEAS